MKKFEYKKHTADLVVKSYGNNLPELFENMAFGMYNAITSTDKVEKSTKSQEIKIKGDTSEDLLVGFLNELLFITQTEKVVFNKFNISILPDGIRAIAYSTPLLDLKYEIKAATFHNLEIKKNKFYCAEVIFDI